MTPIHRLHDWTPTLGRDCFVAPGAQLIGRVFCGDRVNIWFNAVVRGDVDEIRIGEESNIQDGCILHVDAGVPLFVGNRVTVGHGAILHGCHIEDEVLIGMGATVLNGARIGRGSLVAAGAMVREGQEVPPLSLVVGLPAIVKRSLPEAETLRSHREQALHYVDGARKYREASSQEDHA